MQDNEDTTDEPECIELELESDGTISLEGLKIHFGSAATGLKYKNPETKAWRLLSSKEEKIKPSRFDITYYVWYQKTSEAEGIIYIYI